MPLHRIPLVPASTSTSINVVPVSSTTIGSPTLSTVVAGISSSSSSPSSSSFESSSSSSNITPTEGNSTAVRKSSQLIDFVRVSSDKFNLAMLKAFPWYVIAIAPGSEEPKDIRNYSQTFSSDENGALQIKSVWQKQGTCVTETTVASLVAISVSDSAVASFQLKQKKEIPLLSQLTGFVAEEISRLNLIFVRATDGKLYQFMIVSNPEKTSYRLLSKAQTMSSLDTIIAKEVMSTLGLSWDTLIFIAQTQPVSSGTASSSSSS